MSRPFFILMWLITVLVKFKIRVSDVIAPRTVKRRNIKNNGIASH